MSGIETWGVSLILWLQSFRSPALDFFFKTVTMLGDERFYLLLLSFVYWCVDKQWGIRLAVLIMVSSTINAVLKSIFCLPRPPLELRLVDQDGYGFPSGHTQGATVTFGLLAYRARKAYAFIVAAFLILTVALSRVYLGVHYPHDVVGGLVFGLLVLCGFIAMAPRMESWWLGAVRVARYVGAFCFPLAVLAIWPVEGVASTLGALAGLALGEMIELENVGFSPGGRYALRALRFFVGALLIGGLYYGLKIVPLSGVAWRYVRYAVVGLCATAAMPWLFVRLGLARPEAPAVTVA